jgi:hypothetical protein
LKAGTLAAFARTEKFFGACGESKAAPVARPSKKSSKYGLFCIRGCKLNRE